MNNFVIFCNTWDLKIVMEILLWKIFENLKMRDKNWMKTAIICSSVQIWFLIKFFYLSPFTQPRCLQSFGVFWPTKSPDLNPLIFFSGDYLKSLFMILIHRSLQQLKKIVELCARNVSRETLIKVAQNFRKRATLCLANEGGHFEHLLK